MQGVRCTVVERHPATTVQYKFAGISPRSMEIYRSADLQHEIRAHRTGDQKAGEIARARNLSDPEVHFLGKPWADMSELTAATAETCDQDRLEPILRSHAERLGADVRFNTELVAIEQDAREVRGRVRNRATGEEETIVASYAIAADGIGGKVREWLGIGRSGPGVLQHWVNLIFDTDLQPFLQDRRFTSCFVTDVNGSIVPREDRWLLALQYDPDRGEKLEDFDQNRTTELVRRASGRADTRVKLFDARDWAVAAYIAERFCEGRIFLLGDAAHAMPPTGGFGGNTGIHDAHNLAWKLACVLRGSASPALLDTYDAERRFVAEHTLRQALARLSAWFKDQSNKLPPPEAIEDDAAVIFGYVYPEGAFVPERRSDHAFEDPRQPSGRPGSRAPHFMVDYAGACFAVHDLLAGRFTLLAGPEGQAWRDASNTDRKVPLQFICVDGAAETTRRFRELYGVNARGAVLVRPDGFIAWRSVGGVDDPVAAVDDALTRIGIAR